MWHFSSDGIGPVDCTVDLVVEFIKSQVTTDDSSVRRLRGPFLAQLELMSLLKDRRDNRWNTVFGAFLTLDSAFCLILARLSRLIILKGELNPDKKWQSDDLFYIIMNEIRPRFNQFCVILKLS